MFRDLSHETAQAAAALIRQDRLHVLVDLNGWIDGARPTTLALQPAPVVLSYLTFIGTTGTGPAKVHASCEV